MKRKASSNSIDLLYEENVELKKRLRKTEEEIKRLKKYDGDFKSSSKAKKQLHQLRLDLVRNHHCQSQRVDLIQSVDLSKIDSISSSLSVAIEKEERMQSILSQMLNQIDKNNQSRTNTDVKCIMDSFFIRSNSAISFSLTPTTEDTIAEANEKDIAEFERVQQNSIDLALALDLKRNELQQTQCFFEVEYIASSEDVEELNRILATKQDAVKEISEHLRRTNTKLEDKKSEYAHLCEERDLLNKKKNEKNSTLKELERQLEDEEEKLMETRTSDTLIKKFILKQAQKSI